MHLLDSLVDRLGQWVQLDLRYYGKNVFYLALAQVALVISSLALTMAFARLVPKETYGQYSYIMAIIGLLTLFSLPGMGTAIVRSVARGYDQTFVHGTKERLKWSLIGSLIMLCVGIYYYHFGDSIVLGKSFIIVSFLFPFYSTAETFRSFQYGKSHFAQASIYQSTGRLVSVVVAIVVMWLLEDLLLIILAYLVSSCLINYFFLVKLARGKGLNKEIDKEALPYAKHLTLQAAVGRAVEHYDRIIIPIFLTFSDLAIYSIAMCVNFITAFLSTPLAPIFPKLAQMDEKGAYQAVKKRLIYVVLGYGIVCGIGIALAPYIIPLLYTDKYLQSVLYAQILLVAIFLEAPGHILAQLYKAQKKIGELYRLRLFVSVSEMVLLTVLVANFGLLGVVMARVIGRASLSAVAWWLSR